MRAITCPDVTVAPSASTISAITPADEKFLDSVSEKVAIEWANGLNARGKPGTETLAAVKQAVAATK